MNGPAKIQIAAKGKFKSDYLNYQPQASGAISGRVKSAKTFVQAKIWAAW